MKKFRGFTREEAINKAKIELGSNIRIISEQEIVHKRFFGLLISREFEISVESIKDTNYKKNNIEKNINKIRYNTDINLSNKHISDIQRQLTNNSKKILKILKQNRVNQKKDLKDRTIPKTEKNTLTQNNNLKYEVDRLQDEIVTIKNRMTELSQLMLNSGFPIIQKKSEKIPEFPKEIMEIYNILTHHNVKHNLRMDICEQLTESLNMRGNKRYPGINEDFKGIIRSMLGIRGYNFSLNTNHIISIVGPTGVGKTTSLVKLAYKWRSFMNSYNVEKKGVFLCLDVFRIGAQYQSEKYCSLISFEHEIVTEPQILQERVSDYLSRDYGMIIIDVSGKSPKDQDDIVELSTTLEGIYSDNYLAINANYKEDDIKNIFDNFSIINLKGSIITKIDEAKEFGFFINLYKYFKKFPIYALSDGQEVDHHFKSADINSIISLLKYNDTD